MNIFDPNDTDFNSYDHSEPSEEQAAANEAASTPATEIVKAARKAKKPAKKASAKKEVTPVQKKKVTKVKKTAKKVAAKKTASGKPGGERRGPGSPNKIVRKGDLKFGARMQKARKARGWSQAALGERVGMTQGHCANIERGTINGSAGLLAKIRKALKL